MNYAVPIALFLHVTAVVVWVGGMTFAHVCLRPALADLSPQLRMPVSEGVFGRFFNLTALAIVLILLSGGFLMQRFGGIEAPWPIFGMALTGVLMMLVYAYIRFAVYPRLRRAVQAQKWPEGAKALASIRRMVLFNLVLGYLTIAMAVVH